MILLGADKQLCVALLGADEQLSAALFSADEHNTMRSITNLLELMSSSCQWLFMELMSSGK